MARYVVGHEAPRSDHWWVERPMDVSLTVDGPERVDTGLVTKAGAPIYRVAPPIGFGRDSEW